MKLNISEAELKDAVQRLVGIRDFELVFNSLIYNIKTDKKQRKIENALSSVRKYKASGRVKVCGRPKIRNDERIKLLREQGLSYIEIAKDQGISTTAIQRSLKGKK